MNGLNLTVHSEFGKFLWLRFGKKKKFKDKQRRGVTALHIKMYMFDLKSVLKYTSANGRSFIGLNDKINIKKHKIWSPK